MPYGAGKVTSMDTFPVRGVKFRERDVLVHAKRNEANPFSYDIYITVDNAATTKIVTVHGVEMVSMDTAMDMATFIVNTIAFDMALDGKAANILEEVVEGRR